MSNRQKKLQRNQKLMKFIYTAFRFNAIISVISLFYIIRSLSESNIFVLTIIFAISTILFEVPSSFLADKFGRKKTLIISFTCKLIYIGILLFANSLIDFATATFFYGISHAMYSGTDTALVYDTQKELEETTQSTKTFGNYLAAPKLLKFVTIITVGLLINQIQEWQFLLILATDFIIILTGLVLLTLLIEPKRNYHVQDPKIIQHAISIIRKKPNLIKLGLNQNLVFMATLLPFLQLQSYFTAQGLQPYIINLFHASHALILYFTLKKVHKWFANKNDGQKINIYNFGALLAISLSIFGIIIKNPLVTLIGYELFTVTANNRFPLFSTLLNNQISSHNRATTLSIINFSNMAIQIPAAALVAWLIIYNQHASFWVALIMMLFTILFLSFTAKDHDKQSVSS